MFSIGGARRTDLKTTALGESYTSILRSDAVGFSGPELFSDSQRQWTCVLCSDESTFQPVSGKKGRRVLSPKDQMDLPDFHQQQIQKQTSVMVWGCISANVMGDWVPLTWRHIL